MKIYFIFLILSLFLISNVQAIVINEFMPNPPDVHDSSEWIEITSHFNTSLKNIAVDTGNGPITLNGSIEENEFIIITKNSSAFKKIWDSEVRIFESSKVKLNNKGDNISLYNGSSLLQKIEYNASETNISYGLCNSTFILQNISTPGLPNICLSGNTNQTNETNETGMTNETCDLSLTIASDLIFISGEKHNYYLSVEDKKCDQKEKEVSIEYWIEDLFGEMIRSRYTTTQSITCYKNISRQWTPKETEGSEAFYIKARITNLTCNDSDHSNDLAEKVVIVKGRIPDSEECPPCEIKETTCSYGSCPKCICEEEEEKETKDFKIISFPEEIEKNKEIEIEVEINNTSIYRKDYTVYSYVYEGNKILSEGFDGNFWFNTWDANRQNVSIPGNSSITLTLKNRIAIDTKPGKYDLRVRIRFDDEKRDLTKNIIIKESFPKPSNQTIEEENEASDEFNFTNETIEMDLPTGRIISKREENWFSTFIENVINFFKNLFNL
ncbi:MAG: hypothetical protein GTN76_12235 [Candidatus Aenigmarchaeota archaeon]|nr:hypothetical protein [Candidatus Aenigmarchaeota archaeon]